MARRERWGIVKRLTDRDLPPRPSPGRRVDPALDARMDSEALRREPVWQRLWAFLVDGDEPDADDERAA